MIDAELIARLRNTPNWMREGFQNWKDNVRTYDTAPFEAADRIEALTKERDQHWDSFVHWRKEADDRSEQLNAARQDAKEAEAYAEELAEELRDTQDRANAFATKEYYTEMRAERAEAKLAKAVEALAPLAAIADAFDANELDDEARKFWGQHSFNTTPHEDIELYQGRGGRQLLTLANCMFARATLAEIKGENHDRSTTEK